MQHSHFLLLLLLSLQCTIDQHGSPQEIKQGEFVIYDNGLIYDNPTMSKLGQAVDSLNIRFRKCESKKYASLEQGYGTYISINRNLRKACKAMAENISLDAFLRLFPATEVQKNLWIVKERDDYDGKPVIHYHSEGKEFIHIYVPDDSLFDTTGGWLFQDDGFGLDILYLYGLRASPIPLEYARLIQYVDCMVDTLVSIYPKERKPDSLVYQPTQGKVKEYLALTMDLEPEPKEPEPTSSFETMTTYDSVMSEWNSRRITVLDKKMRDRKNIQLLEEAVRESVMSQNGFFLDYYVERYLSPARSLEIKRSFRVRGFCSMDTGPRDHARAICKLAAETYQWDIFLRAHLDIMSDNFERAMDGLRAQNQRETYIAELEELDIDVVELLIGTTLNARNLSKNHYRADRFRIGRALAESKRKEETIDLLLCMIQDEHLDLYNRMEMAYTLIALNRNQPSKQAYLTNLERIKKALKSLPEALAQRYSPVMSED